MDSALASLERHPLYDHLYDVESIRVFMENHVFSVWLFMCLLENLVLHSSGDGGMWLPPHNHRLLRVLRSIMIEEETDSMDGNHFTSHLEMYIGGMEEIGASVADIRKTLSQVETRGFIDDVFVRGLSVLNTTKEYITSHLSILSPDTPFLSIFSYFTYGRELIIPGMFQRILDNLGNSSLIYPTFTQYLERHVDLDQIHLWDGIYDEILTVSDHCPVSSYHQGNTL